MPSHSRAHPLYLQKKACIFKNSAIALDEVCLLPSLHTPSHTISRK